MTRQDKTETLYMYTCLGIPVTSTNKSKDVIVNHIDASGNEIYDWLRQSKWMDAGAGGLEARHGRTLGGCRWRDARRGQRLVPLHGNYNCCRCHATHFEPGKMLRGWGCWQAWKNRGPHTPWLQFLKCCKSWIVCQISLFFDCFPWKLFFLRLW